MKRRNGLLEIYRLILCFWPMYYHHFFFTERDYSRFTVAELSVDFFYVLSGFFLIQSMKKKSEESTFMGMLKMMYGRLRPMLFSICFISGFSLICVGLFVESDYLNTLFEIFKYWWFVLYLVIAVGVFYLLYRLVKNKAVFGVIMFILSLSMGIFHYHLAVRGFFIFEFTFVARTLGCIALGVLVSYIPAIKNKRLLISIPVVAVLFVALMYHAYSEKSYNMCIVMIVMFAFLVYFSSNIPVGGRVFDIMGKLGMRIYLYLPFITVIYYLGITHHRILFVLDITLAVLDLILDSYRTKYRALKAKVEIPERELISK